MGAQSKIQWTDATWNPIRGCSRVSEGCRNCYAERMAARGLPGLNSPTTGKPFALATASGPRWTGQVELIESALSLPLRWRRPRRVFVNSISDLFHEALPLVDLLQVFDVMSKASRHTFQVLTKRADRMLRCLGEPETFSRRQWQGARIPWPLPNVWLGVSVEDRKNKARIDALRKTPAALRFLSLEPLLENLGPLDLRGIGWAIVGSESGPGARPMDPDWARSLHDQCQAAGVPFFFKQTCDERGRKIPFEDAPADL